MKCLIIGGNRFVGLRLSLMLESVPGIELHIFNRTGQAPHCKNAVVHKGDRNNLSLAHLDRDWDVVFDFACYNQAQAESAVQYFKSVSHYVFISTMSVYGFAPDLKEPDFNAGNFDLKIPALVTDDPGFLYQAGKRRAEAVFTQQAPFPVLCVRFPFILGPDDYTRRLNFHIERIRRGEPIHIANLATRVSMIHSEDAAAFLFWAPSQQLNGPLNVASEKPLALRDLIQQIELVTGRKAILSPEIENENLSPYGAPEDFFMNVRLLKTAGFSARAILEWLPELIGVPDTAPRGSYVH